MPKSQQSWVDPSILRHSWTWGVAADEAVLIKVHKKNLRYCFFFLPCRYFLQPFHMPPPSVFTLAKDSEIEPSDCCNVTAKTLLTTAISFILNITQLWFTVLFVLFLLIYSSLVANSDLGHPGLVCCQLLIFLRRMRIRIRIIIFPCQNKPIFSKNRRFSSGFP